MEFRFAVGRPDGPQSLSWKFWTQGDEAYLLNRGGMAKFYKFSFHKLVADKPANCRWAEINPKLKGSERAVLEWTCDPAPDTGSGQGRLLLSLTFPTNHLSAPRGATSNKLSWVAPSPPDEALQVEVVLIRETRVAINKLLAISEHRQLLSCHSLRSGMHVCLIASAFDCGPVEMSVPGTPVKPGQIFGELSFPDKDEQNTGRPIRMVMMSGSAIPPPIWELGGYEVKSLVGATRSQLNLGDSRNFYKNISL